MEISFELPSPSVRRKIYLSGVIWALTAFAINFTNYGVWPVLPRNTILFLAYYGFKIVIVTISMLTAFSIHIKTEGKEIMLLRG